MSPFVGAISIKTEQVGDWNGQESFEVEGSEEFEKFAQTIAQINVLDCAQKNSSS